jgi:MinD-like ATPase involved in chromosome partitioning or flagellar assembly
LTHETRPHEPTRADQGVSTVTTDNDAPQTSGEDARRAGVFDWAWHNGADDLARLRDGLREGSNGAAEVDDGRQANHTDHHLLTGPYPFSSGYPQPSFYPSAEPSYPQAPGYPQGPGYAPIPKDYPGLDEPGYAPDPGYPGYPQDAWSGLDSGSAPDQSYSWDSGYPGYPQGPGYGYEADARAPREVLHDRDARRAPQLWADGRDDLLPHPGDPVYAWETTSGSLSTDSVLHARRPGPGSGWRRGVYRMTGGLLSLGEPAADMRRRDLINRIRTPVARGHHRIAVLSLKGGVGKTTTAVALGATFATLRGDRVIAVDANPDRGTLSDKVRLETAATIRDLLNERAQIRRYADVRAFTSQAPSRLEILASDRDPAVSVAFGAGDYCDVARVLEHFYSICLTDCGTGLLHSAMSGVLQLADQIVVVSSPSVDGARSASATLDWLDAHDCGDLVRNGVVVLSAIRPKSKSSIDLDRLEHHFAARCRAVVRIPYDPHLEEGAEVELELLGSQTADAYLALSAIVGDALAWPRRLTYRSALP